MVRCNCPRAIDSVRRSFASRQTRDVVHAGRRVPAMESRA